MQNCIFIRHIQQTSWKIRPRSQTSRLSGSYFMPVCHARPLGKCQMICLSLMHVSLWKPLHSSLQHPFGYASWICIGLVNVCLRYDNIRQSKMAPTVWPSGFAASGASQGAAWLQLECSFRKKLEKSAFVEMFKSMCFLWHFFCCFEWSCIQPSVEKILFDCHFWLQKIAAVPCLSQCWNSGLPLRFWFQSFSTSSDTSFECEQFNIQYSSFMEMYECTYYTYDVSCVCYATCPIRKCLDLCQLKKIFWQPWLRCIEE